MELSDIKSKLLSVDNSERNEILKLLLYAYSFNEELIEDGFYIELYNKLSKDYKPLIEDKKGLELDENIRDEKVDKTIDNYSFVTLEHIMSYIKGEKGVDSSSIYKLIEYNIRVNTKYTKQWFIDNIKRCISKKVYAVSNENGRYSIDIGIIGLNDGAVTIDNQRLSDSVFLIKCDQDIIYYLPSKQFTKKKRNKINKIISTRESTENKTNENTGKSMPA